MHRRNKSLVLEGDKNMAILVGGITSLAQDVVNDTVEVLMLFVTSQQNEFKEMNSAKKEKAKDGRVKLFSFHRQTVYKQIILRNRLVKRIWQNIICNLYFKSSLDQRSPTFLAPWPGLM